MLRSGGAGVSARVLACRCMARCGRWIIGVAFGGMAGFVIAALAISCGWLGVGGFLVATGGSLAAFFASLAVGHFGDPGELQRLRYQRARTERDRAGSNPPVSAGELAR